MREERLEPLLNTIKENVSVAEHAKGNIVVRSWITRERERERGNLLSFEIEFSPRERKREKVSNLVVHHPGNGFQFLFLEAGDPRRDIRIPNVKTEAALHSVAKWIMVDRVPCHLERKENTISRYASLKNENKEKGGWWGTMVRSTVGKEDREKWRRRKRRVGGISRWNNKERDDRESWRAGIHRTTLKKKKKEKEGRRETGRRKRSEIVRRAVVELVITGDNRLVLWSFPPVRSVRYA